MVDRYPQNEIRCPIHGLIPFDDWEKQVISHAAFQRLRRIRQLAWTDEVYPGGVHTRFEHSLGVMHTASLLYDAIVRNSPDVLQELGFLEGGFHRHKRIVRFAALLHDIGHSPFSHASEELFPDKASGGHYLHEQYSAAIVRGPLRQAIEEHETNHNFNITAEDIAALLEGTAGAKQGVFWRPLITSQMDADRMDYLLRDSHHCGVPYGTYDLQRLIATIVVLRWPDRKSPRIGVQEGGWHSAEALVIARYLMFTQVYFHKTRAAFDIHLRNALKEILPGGVFPIPVGADLERYLEWDDWKVQGLLRAGAGGEHGKRLIDRDHYREIYHTPEVCSAEDLVKLARAKELLGEMLAAEELAEKSWYRKGDSTDIPILGRRGGVLPLSRHSKVIEGMRSNNQAKLYVRPEHKVDAAELLRKEFKDSDETT